MSSHRTILERRQKSAWRGDGTLTSVKLKKSPTPPRIFRASVAWFSIMSPQVKQEPVFLHNWRDRQKAFGEQVSDANISSTQYKANWTTEHSIWLHKQHEVSLSSSSSFGDLLLPDGCMKKDLQQCSFESLDQNVSDWLWHWAARSNSAYTPGQTSSCYPTFPRQNSEGSPGKANYEKQNKATVLQKLIWISADIHVLLRYKIDIHAV